MRRSGRSRQTVPALRSGHRHWLSTKGNTAHRRVAAYHHFAVSAGFHSGVQPVPVHRTTDGVELVYHSLGAGPHVLLLHGTSTDHTTWEPVQSALAERFQLSILTRRGRCRSGDSSPYVLQREFEDVATLVDALGGPVDIVGHSFGALCALEGALRARNVRRLVLYESPLPGAFDYWPDAVRDRMMPLLNSGQPEQALRTFMEAMLGLSQ